MAIIERDGAIWRLTPLTDDGRRIPEESRVYASESAADAALARMERASALAADGIDPEFE